MPLLAAEAAPEQDSEKMVEVIADDFVVAVAGKNFCNLPSTRATNPSNVPPPRSYLRTVWGVL